MIWIGIDCGKKTGYAEYEPNNGLRHLETTSFWQAYYKVLEYDPAEVAIAVEDPAQNKPTFDHGADGKAVNRVSQNVGGVKRESRLLIEGLRRNGFLVLAVRPNTAKWNKQTLRNFTGWTGKSSEHSRDAAKIVFGRSALSKAHIQNFLQQQNAR